MSTFRRSNRRVKAGKHFQARQRLNARRRIGCEQLEGRLMLAANPLQNPYNHLDVNDDGAVAPGDVLIVFNALNQSNGESEATVSDSPKFMDVNGDGVVAPMDGLMVINALNAEGEDAATMTYILRTFDEAGTAEISQIGVGQNFQLRVFVRDNRVLGNFPNGKPREGVFAAYLDVKYPAALADVAGTFVHNINEYGEAPSGNTATDGIIDGAGSFRGSLTPLGRAEFLLWSLPMTATAQGAITFVGEPTTDPTDPGDQGQSPSLDTGLYGEDKPIAPSSAPGAVGSMGFTNVTLNVVTDIAAGNDAFTVAEDANATSPTPSVLANDTVLNPPGTTPVITAVTQGSNGATVTFTATNISYKPAANFSGQDVITYTISNGQTATAIGTVTVTVTAANDAPVVTVPGAQTSPEDTALVFNTVNNRKVSFSDPDGDVSVQATLAVTNGKLTIPASAGVTITGNDTGSVQLTGIISAINTALDGGGVTYQPTADFSGSDSLIVTVNDQGNTGGTALSDSKTVAITVSALNDAPKNTLPGNLTTNESEALTLSTANGNALSVSDVDAGSSPIMVRLSIDTGGVLNLVSTTGVTVSNNGTKTVDITGSVAAISTALGAGVTFTPDALFLGPVAFTMVSNDQGATGSGGAITDTDTFTITVIPALRPRAVNNTATVEENSTTGVTINVLQNDVPNVGAQATLLSFTQPAAGGTVTLVENGAGNTDDALKFVPTAGFSGIATFTYTINDTLPAGDPNKGVDSIGTVNVTVAAVNDAPVNTVPGAQAATEDTALVINGIIVADIDAGSGNIEVSLSVANGKINVTAGAATAANNGTASVKLTGTLTAVNAALATGVTYTPNTNFNGADTLTVVTNDMGNTGIPGPLTDTDSVAINVAAVNDAPVNTVPVAQKATKDQAFVLSAAAGNVLQIADVDAGSSNVQVTLTIANGALNVGASAGVTVTGNGSGSLGLNGSVSSINTALSAGVTYTPTTGFAGTTTLTMVTSDLGNTGGAAQTDTDTVSILVEDFTPSTIGGQVYVDSNVNGTREATELGLAGVTITLTGQDVRGALVNDTRVTDSTGKFSFAGLKPGTYTIEQDQPSAMLDGADSPGTGFVAAGKNRATITIVAPGGVISTNTLFGEMGLEAHFLSASDLLASSAQTDQNAGVLFGSDGLTAWSIIRGESWKDYDNARFTILNRSADGRYATITLTCRHKITHPDNSVTFTDESTTLNSAIDARLIYIQDGGETVIRFTGPPEGFFKTAAAEGEAEMTAADYSRAVDQVMAEAVTQIA